MESTLKEEENKLYVFDRDKACEDFDSLLNSLESFHSLFYELGTLGVPEFTEEIETAAVVFYKNTNRVGFKWNPKFWDNLSNYQRQFIACHEALHVFLSHGKRTIEATQPQVANIAADIVVNHMLVDNFGFSRVALREFGKQIVWLDTTFDKSKIGTTIKRNQSLEYYYQKLLEEVREAIKEGKLSPGKSSGKGGITIYPDDEFKDLFGETLDDHDGFKQTIDQEAEESINNKLSDRVDDDDKADFKELTKEDESKLESTKGKKAGTLSGKMCYVVKKKKVKYNYKYSDIIKNWKLRQDRPQEREEVWHYPNRRISNLHNLFLPTEYEGEKMGQAQRVDVWFFMDTSGSCVHLKDKFFNAAKSFPEDKFNVRPFCFDTKVYDISLKDGNLYGFGGTRFDIIESRIQEVLKTENKKYPDVVFLFTDGYGNSVSPEYPERWYWFLDGDSSYPGLTTYIHNKSHTYKIKDFTE